MQHCPQDGHVLEQNRGSREFYGALGKEGMWSKAAGPQAASEKLCPAHAEGSLQGILLELFAADDTKMLAGLLQVGRDGGRGTGYRLRVTETEGLQSK
eukprot:1138628-Pelagomonas_calceolata.AAC.2